MKRRLTTIALSLLAVALLIFAALMSEPVRVGAQQQGQPRPNRNTQRLPPDQSGTEKQARVRDTLRRIRLVIIWESSACFSLMTIFLEVKTGNSSLSPRQKQIKRLVESLGSQVVTWEQTRIPDKI